MIPRPYSPSLPRAVIAVLYNDSFQVLAVSRGQGSNQWGLVGGKEDPGETPEQAIIREVQEETGLLLRDPEVVYADVEDSNPESPFYVTTFVGKWEGQPRDSDEGNVRWVPWERVLNGPFGAYTLRLLGRLAR